MTYLFMQNSDQRKYWTLMTKFQTEFSLGKDEYPKTIRDAVDVLVNYKWDVIYGQDQKQKKQQ